MSYLLKVNPEGFYYKNDFLEENTFDNFYILSKNFNEKELGDLVKDYQNGKLLNSLNKCNKNHFLLILYSVLDKILYVFNDKLASNEILFFEDGNEIVISNDIKLIYKNIDRDFEIDEKRAYEFLIFSYINPPYTIYKNIKSVPIASFLFYDAKKREKKVGNYWDLCKLVGFKELDYQKLVREIRQSLIESILQEPLEDICIALSGGVDSGGLLGILTKLKNKEINSITIGPYGKKSGDLKSSRKTASFTKSNNEEIYPEINDLKKLKRYLRGLNQPLGAHFVLFNGLILDRAKEKFIKRIFYAFGTDAMLGTQKYSRLAYFLEKSEQICPFTMLKIIYKIAGKIFKFSKNQIKILLSESWSERFFYIKGPAFVYEKNYLKFKDEYFLDSYINELDRIFKLGEIDCVDKLVLADRQFWHIYKQVTSLSVFSKNFDILPLFPFYSPQVTQIILRTPNKFRRLNRWNKKIIRDVLKPYISYDLYKRKPKSVIFPYNIWFKNNYKIFINYLKTSKIINRLVDLCLYERDFINLPQPGASLIRLLGLAIWYDVNWNEKNLDNFNIPKKM